MVGLFFADDVKAERFAVYVQVQDAAEDRLGWVQRRQSKLRTSETEALSHLELRALAANDVLASPAHVNGCSPHELEGLASSLRFLSTGIFFATCRAITVCISSSNGLLFLLVFSVLFLYSFCICIAWRSATGGNTRRECVFICFYIWMFY